MTQTDKRRTDPGKWLMLCGVFAVSLALFYLLTLRPSSDISIHTTWAGEGDFRDPTTFLRHGAHPLWHVLVCLVERLGVPLKAASALVTALCKTAEVWLIHRLMTAALGQRLRRGMITFLTFVCATVSCLCLPFYNPTVYLGVGTPNTWHSCTQLIAMVFMLLCVPYVARMHEHFLAREPLSGARTLLPWRETIGLGVLLFFSLLAKPTFMQAFLPAACLYFLWQWIRYPQNSRYFLQIIVCILPAVVFMIVQYLYYFGIIVPWQANMVLEISWQKGWDVLVRVVLIQAFPLYVLFTCRPRKADPFFTLTLLFNAVAIVEFLLLGENGRRSADGNFGWGMMGAALMMWVASMMRFFREEDALKPTAKTLPGWILLGWHFLSGLYYIGYLFLSGSSL